MRWTGCAASPVTAPPGYNGPSQAGEILGVNVTPQARAGRHTVEVVQLATAHQIRADAITDKSAALAGLGIPIGDLVINGVTVTLDADDTLLDLRDKINSTNGTANTGETPSGVTASIVSVGETEHYLVLSADKTGKDNAVTLGGDAGITEALGLTASGNIKTETVAARDAIFRVDRLGVEITRASNTVDDVIEGVTLDLFKAEPGTEITVDIEPDLKAVKQSLAAVVEAVNALKDFIADQQQEKVRTEGSKEKEYGALAFTGILRTVSQRLNHVIASSVPGAAPGAASLGQIGIEFTADYRLKIDDGKLDTMLMTKLDDVRRLFEFRFSANDSRVAMVSFDAKTEPRIDALTGKPLPYKLDIAGTDADGNPLGTTIRTGTSSPADSGSAIVDGRVITATDTTGAHGLKLLFNGGPNAGPVNGIVFTVSRGLGDRLFHAMDDLAAAATGRIDREISSLSKQNEQYQDRIDAIDERLAVQRKSMMARFIAMEQAVARSRSLLASLKQQTAALTGARK